MYHVALGRPPVKLLLALTNEGSGALKDLQRCRGARSGFNAAPSKGALKPSRSLKATWSSCFPPR